MSKRISIKYGYIRVSTKEQKEGRQLKAILNHGILEENIFIDKTSGKTFNRTEYNKMLNILKSGDTLCISSIDRLGRNYNGILEQWNLLTKIKKIKMEVLDTSILNTDETNNTLIDTYLKDITLLTLAFQAEQEFINIKERQTKGIEVAKEKGKHLGRPKANPNSRKLKTISKIINDWQQGNISQEEAMKRLNRGRTTLYNFGKLYGKGGEKT